MRLHRIASNVFLIVGKPRYYCLCRIDYQTETWLAVNTKIIYLRII